MNDDIYVMNLGMHDDAGFSSEETHRIRCATKAVLPRLHHLIGGALDSRAQKAAAAQMEVGCRHMHLGTGDGRLHVALAL